MGIEGFVNVTKKQGRYRFASYEWWPPAAANGKNNLFVDVLDTNGDRLVAERVHFLNGGEVVGVTEEKPDDPGGVNIGMTGCLGSYTVWAGDDRQQSDEVSGLGLGTPEEPDVKHHAVFVVRFTKLDEVPEPEPPPEPEPEPGLPPSEDPNTWARGFYLSANQDKLDEAAVERDVRAGKIHYLMIETSAGLKKNGLYEEQYAWAANLGIPLFAFHWLTADEDGQARFVADLLRGTRFSAVFCDMDEGELTDGRVKQFMDHLTLRLREMDYNVPLGIYTNPKNGRKLGAWAAKYLLWLAHWTYDLRTKPMIPSAWKDAGKTWTFWQWDGEQLGYGDIICPDCFHGTPEQLLARFPVEQKPPGDDERLPRAKALLQEALALIEAEIEARG